MRASFCRRDDLQAAGNEVMGKGILLWLIGIPIPIIILLWLFFPLGLGLLRRPPEDAR